MSDPEDLLRAVTPTLDAPSARIMTLRENERLGENDKIIFGTGDSLGAVTYTSDLTAVTEIRRQGVYLSGGVFMTPGYRLKGM